MTKARENSDYTGLAADITAGDTAARAGRKNLIINGGFDVWQRGTTATKSGDGYGGYLSADRWATYYSGNTISRQTGTFNGSTKYVARVAGSAGSTNYIYQKIESASSFVSGKTVTQSYWARANVAVTLYSEYRFYNSGAETNNVQTTLPTVSLTTSWQKITDTRVLTDSSTDLTRDLFVLFKADCNSAGDYIEIADVQLELGSVATDFEHRSYGEILADCHRYCFVLGNSPSSAHRIATGLSNSSTTVYAMVAHPVIMRSLTTLTVASISNMSVSNASVGTGLTGLAVQGVVSSTKATGLTATTAGGLTAQRPYFIEGTGTNIPVNLVFDAEL